jgi:hypothetical protein
VRVGIHTGTPLVTDEGYVGADVHRAARIAACGHGGQVLVSATTAALVANDRLRDLGMHRLKDLSAPERIYQLGDGEFPPLKSLYQTNLPIPVTPFVGREKELGEVLALMVRADLRLLTLTGPGGTGKTRLGAQAAGALAERYSYGVWWIPLASLRDSSLVVETAAQAVGAQNGLANHIGDKSMLLLFEKLRTRDRWRAGRRGRARFLSEARRARHEPRTAARQRRAGVSRAAFRSSRGCGFFLARAVRSIRASRSTMQSPRSAGGSMICRSRSSSRRHA